MPITSKRTALVVSGPPSGRSMPRLIRSSRTVPIAFAADRVTDLGEHVPHVTALASDAYDRSCFGPGAGLPLR